MNISTKELADILGISTRRVSQLTSEGVLTRVKRGEYDLKACVQAFIEFKAATASPDDWREARTQHLKVRTEREKLALECDRLRAEISESSEMLDRKFWELMATRLDVSNELTNELREKNCIVPGREFVVANVASALIAGARRSVMIGLEMYRQRQQAKAAKQI